MPELLNAAQDAYPTSKSTGKVAFALEDRYAHWCELHINHHGVIRARLEPWPLLGMSPIAEADS